MIKKFDERRFGEYNKSRIGSRSNDIRITHTKSKIARATTVFRLHPALRIRALPFKQWVWSSNLQRVTKKADTHLGICFLAVWRFENLDVTVLWTVTWHRLDDANSLPGAFAPGSESPAGHCAPKSCCKHLQQPSETVKKRTGAGAPKAPLCKGSWHEVTEGL